MCLCRLHNFCINERLINNEEDDDDMDDIPEAVASDHFEIATGGGIPLEPSRTDPEMNATSPEQLLHGGDHFDDAPRVFRRRVERQENSNKGTLPRDLLHVMVVEKALVRPLCNSWANKA